MAEVAGEVVAEAEVAGEVPASEEEPVAVVAVLVALEVVWVQE